MALRRLIHFGVFTISLAGAVSVFGQEALIPRSGPAVPIAPSYRLTLEDAKQRALAVNKDLVLGQLGVREKSEAIAAARADYLPKLLANVNYFHFNDNLGVVNTVRTGRLGLLPPGTQSIAVTAINQNSSLAAITLAQPITKLIAINAATKIARADREIAQAQLDKGRRELLSGVAEAFHDLLGAQKIEAALSLQVSYAQNLAQAHPSPEVRVALIEARQALNQVQSQTGEIVEQLNNLIGLPAGTVLILDDPIPPAPPVHSADEAASMALVCSPQIREASASITKADAALQLAKADFLPDVNIFGSYFNQTAAPIIQSNFGALGISASYTFVDWGKRRHVKHQREYQRTQAHQNVQVTVDKVVLEARKAYVGFKQARQALALASEMVEARKEAERKPKDPSLSQDAKVATSKAELEYVQAEAAYRIAHARLVAVIGAE